MTMSGWKPILSLIPSPTPYFNILANHIGDLSQKLGLWYFENSIPYVTPMVKKNKIISKAKLCGKLPTDFIHNAEVVLDIEY